MKCVPAPAFLGQWKFLNNRILSAIIGKRLVKYGQNKEGYDEL